MWSCCSVYGRNAQGCTTGSHLRCELTAAALDSFPIVEEKVVTTEGLRRRGGSQQQAAVDPPKASGGPPEDADKYTCGLGCSLKRIALMHGMNEATVRRWNKLLSPNVYPGQTLWVKRPPPPTAAEVRAEALTRIVSRAGCSQPEAAYYLDESGDGHDVERALAAILLDAQASGDGDGDGWVVVDSGA